MNIPARVLMNVRTLPKVKDLNAVQRVVLHLLVHRPRGGEAAGPRSDDVLFGPFIDTLPASFEDHPLTWQIHHAQQLSFHKLYDHLPPSTRTILDSLEKRFSKDCIAVEKHLAQDPVLCNVQWFKDKARLIDDLIWAWLNVNTRCLYHRLSRRRSDPANFTMGPLIDFANHTSTGPHMITQATQADIFDCAPTSTFGEPLVIFAPAGKPTASGAELRLKYGAHSRRVLFVEYGFVDQEAPAEADVQDLLEELVLCEGPLKAKWIRRVLEQEGYWGDWTLHAPAQENAHPSFRLIAALRLLAWTQIHGSLEGCMEEEDRLLAPWRATLMGRTSSISEENEKVWRRALGAICEKMRARGGLALQRLEIQGPIVEHKWVQDMVRSLWKEEIEVATAVQRSIEENVEY